VAAYVFNPTSSGQKVASLAVTGSVAGTTMGSVGASATLSGVGENPAELRFPAGNSYTYGAVTISTTGSAKFTVRNVGDRATSSLTVGIANQVGSDFARVTPTPAGDDCSQVASVGLGAQQSCSVTVEFRPTGAAGSRSATLTVSATTGGSATVSLSGTAAASTPLTVSVSPSATQSSNVGTAVTYTVTLTNPANAMSPNPPVTLGASSLAGSTEFAFSTSPVGDGCAGATLAPTTTTAASCTVTVRFIPTSTTTQTTTLNFNQQGGGVVKSQVLSGTGQRAVLSAPSDVAFGAVAIGSFSDKQFTVTNTGNVATSSAVSVSFASGAASEFSLFQPSTGNCGVLAAGASCTVTVRFTPVAASCPSGASCAVKSATLTAASGTLTPTSTNLTATPQRAASISVAESSWDFTPNGVPLSVGSVSATKTFTFTNGGDVAIASLVTSLSADATTQSYFVKSADTCNGLPLAAGGGQCTVTYKFDLSWQGAVYGARQAVLKVADSALPTRFAQVSLTGVGSDVFTLTYEVLGTGDGDAPPTPPVQPGQCVEDPTNSRKGTCTFVRAATAPTLVLNATAQPDSTFAGFTVTPVGCDLPTVANQCGLNTLLRDGTKKSGTLQIRFDQVLVPVQVNVVESGAQPYAYQATGLVTATYVTWRGQLVTTTLNCGEGQGPCSVQIPQASSVTLTATPTAGSNSTFGAWANACSNQLGTTCSLQGISGNVVVEARFQPANVMFVTAARYCGDMTRFNETAQKCDTNPPFGYGLSGADGLCAEAASKAGLPGTFLAYLSDSSTSVSSRFSGVSGVVRPDFQPIRQQAVGLAKDPMYFPPLLTETGAALTSATNISLDVWTGSEVNGLPATGRCTEWTKDTGVGRIGRADQTNGSYVSAGAQGGSPIDRACNRPAHLYCLQVDWKSTLSVPTAPPAGERVIFVSDGVSFGGGAGNLDQQCRSFAQTAGFSGEFVAFVFDNSGISAAARASLVTTARYYRPDGVLVGTGQDLTSKSPLAPINVTWRQDYIADARVFTGATSPSTAQGGGGTNHCMNWNPGPSATGIAGLAQSTYGWFANNVVTGIAPLGSDLPVLTIPCSTSPARVYCVRKN
jgi:hypothetical protein